ncbi:hypothetical protein GCWU000341_01417 [Oribacterium sp. oral taxon 078 str. F0262]|nr:hypothetical protein GCWU000341_01417 [Oribacterium sp. oral taxon 078 str. F0262]
MGSGAGSVLIRARNYKLWDKGIRSRGIVWTEEEKRKREKEKGEKSRGLQIGRPRLFMIFGKCARVSCAAFQIPNR